MTKKINSSDLPTFDAANFLDNDDVIFHYLKQSIEEDNIDDVLNAIGTVVRAKGMTSVANSAGVNRESLYKSLQPNAKPRYETIQKVCKALGLQLTAKPIDKPVS